MKLSQPKPRIRYRWIRGGWICEYPGDLRCGTGATPVAAYISWRYGHLVPLAQWKEVCAKTAWMMA